MIYDIQMLKAKYSLYSNIPQKIATEIKNHKFIRIKRGLFSDDIDVDAPVIANLCYEPSYLSFEYALSYYEIIPEYVPVYTSAYYNKKIIKNIALRKNVLPIAAFPMKLILTE